MSINKREPWGVFFFLACFSLSEALGGLEPAAQKMLSDLGGKLTPDLVIRYALKSSPSYVSLSSQNLIAESLRLKGSSLTESRVYLKFGYLDERLKPLTPFGASQTVGTRYSAGFNQNFETGTLLNFEMSHGNNDFRIPTFGQFNPVESKATLNLEQSLWQNAFGHGTRSQREALWLTSAATDAGWKESKETWFLDALQGFYSAWLAQRQYEAALKSVGRRERLQRIVERKLSRGTSEKPDALQVKSAYQSARVQASQAKQNLGDVWRELVVGLRLPDQFIEIDPAAIPMEIDAPLKAAEALCGNSSQISAPPASPAALERARLQLEAAQQDLAQSESESSPDLKLGVGLSANSVSAPTGTTLEELFSAKFPSVGINLTLSVPLGNALGKSKLQQAKASLIRREAEHGISADQVKVRWRNHCEDLYRLGQNIDWLTDALKMQTEREKLEDERFSIGRSNTIQVIQAGDDMTDSELRLRNAEVQIRLTAWKIRRLSGDVLKTIANLEN